MQLRNGTGATALAARASRARLRSAVRLRHFGIYDSATESPPCSYRIFIPYTSRGPSADVYY